MTIYRYDMTIPVRVVSALHSGGVDEAPERPITDEDGRTVQPNAFVRNGLGEVILPGRSIKGAIRAAFEEHMNELRFSKEELKSLWGGEMRRDVGTSKPARSIGTDKSLPLRASALTFHHAVVWDRNQGDLPHRMSTAIDRATGGAADGALFAYEYLPVDTTFEIRISAEAQDPAPDPTKTRMHSPQHRVRQQRRHRLHPLLSSRKPCKRSWHSFTASASASEAGQGPVGVASNHSTRMLGMTASW